ncbi:MAG: hypothetical protein ACRDKJ_00880 [Actinomycetota bacterium]
MRRLRVGFAAVVCCAALIGIAPPCFACSCVASTDAEHYERAQVVFTGRAAEGHDPNAGSPTRNSADPIHWTFERESTQKGSVGSRPVVTTTRDEASCGFTFVVGKRYQVFARPSSGGELETNLCGETRDLGADQQPYVPPAATPAPQPPTPAPAAAAPATPAPTATAEPTTSPSPSPTSSPASFVPEVTRTGSSDETSAVPAVLAFVGAVAALGLAVAFLRLRWPTA